MINSSLLRAGQRVLDSDGDYVGTITGVHGDKIAIAQDGVVDSHHEIPVSRLGRQDGDNLYLDGPWSTVLTSLGGVAAAGAAALGGLAASAANAASRVGDKVENAAHNVGARVENTADRVQDRVAGHTTTHTTHHVEEPRRSPWPWLLLLGALALGALLLARGCDKKEVAVTDPAPVTAPVADAPQTVKVGDQEISIAPGQITYSLYQWLQGSEAAPKSFTFDKLNFDTGKAVVREEDKKTIVELGQILKAYPNVKADIVGFTDAVGNQAANDRLSLARSAAVKALIVSQGVAGDRLTAKAGGVAENAGTGPNPAARRTDLVVTAR